MRAIALASALLAVTCLSESAGAQALHEGTFTIGAPSHCGGHSWCPNVVAPGALRDQGLTVTKNGSRVLFGAGSNVVVMVLCVPEGDNSFVAVIATSTTSRVAEEARNKVRSRMQGSRCL